jgi:hypothetical protein
MIKKFLKVVFSACFAFATFTANAQGDGPRAYWPAPKGTQAITPLYTHVNSNSTFENTLFVGGADFNTDVYGLMYSNVFAISGRTAAVVAMVSAGSTKGGIKNIYEGESSGLTDTYVIGLINLYGAPSVDGKGYVETKYNNILDVTLSFKAPTGEYDAEKNINIGTNRWEFKLGFPMMKFFNWGTQKVTSIELLPTYSLFTNNNDISGGETLSQKGLFGLEGHVTRKLTKILWASFDYQYKNGGRASIDDVEKENHINVLMLGGTVGFDITQKFGGYITYGDVVATTSNGMDGNMLKILFSYKF